MKIQISFPDDSQLSVQIKQLKNLGYTNPEMVKAGIRILHKKEFPPYAVNKKTLKDVEEAMTPQEICEDVLGGEVFEEMGVKKCRWQQGNLINVAPLTAIKDQLK
jgi:hypothetical protein